MTFRTDGDDPTLTDFLRQLGLPQLESVFACEDIDLQVLARLNGADLKELGLSLGHRVRLLDAIQGLKADSKSGVVDTPDPRPIESVDKTLAETTSRFESVAERRQLTVMFVDLVDSTVMAQHHDPEDLAKIIRRYQSSCEAIVSSYSALIARYFGDGILVYFGYPTARDNDVERALLAGLDMLAAIESLNARDKTDQQTSPLKIRIGVATGLVVVGESIGDNMSQEQVALGEAPNLAARLQSIAVSGSMVIANRTRQLAADAFEYTDLGLNRIKGYSDPEHCWQVMRSRSRAMRDELAQSTADQSMIGRDGELHLLLSRWKNATDRDGQIVLLSGEAGIGKSCLLRALRQSAAVRQHSALTFYCSEYHQNSALYPVIGLLSQLTQIDSGEDKETAWSKLRTRLSADSGIADDDLILIANLLDIPASVHGSVMTMSRQLIKNRTMEVLTEYCLRLSNIRPLLIVFEDIHWADPSTQELISSLVNTCNSHAIMLVVTYRSGYQSAWESNPQASRISLTRLTASHSEALAKKICGPEALAPDTISTIISRTSGIPVFIEELTKSLVDSGLIDHSKSNSGLPGGQIPVTLHDSLLSRLDQIASAKRVAQIGSAFGRGFEFEDIQEVTDFGDLTLADQLSQLVDAELLYQHGDPPHSSYRFKHALVQDAAYESMLLATRQTLHSQIARTLSSRQQTSPELIAEHYERGGEKTIAAQHWLTAGENAKNQFSLIEADRSLKRCLELTSSAIENHSDNADDISARAFALLGDIAGLHDDLELANRNYSKALDLNTSDEIRHWVSNKQHIQRTALRDGVKLAYDVHGSGSETILLATAILYGLGSLQPALEILCQKYRVITIHPRGSGRSGPLVRPFTTADQAQDLASIIKDDAAGPVTAIGLSRASNNLITMIDEYPSLVNRLITVGCPAKPEFGLAQSSKPEAVERRKQAYENRNIEALVEFLQGNIFTEPGTDQLKNRTIELRKQLPADTILSFFDPAPDVDVSGILNSINIPVLVTHGGKDRQVSIESSNLIARTIPQAKLHIFENSGHIPMVTAAQEFCAVVEEFIGTTNIE